MTNMAIQKIKTPVMAKIMVIVFEEKALDEEEEPCRLESAADGLEGWLVGYVREIKGAMEEG